MRGAKKLILCSAAAAAVALAVASPAAAEVRTFKLRTEAIRIGGYQVKWESHKTATPKIDGFITGMYARVVDRAGRPVPVQQVMLHHVAFMNEGRFRGDIRDQVYCKGKAGERFYGTGEENTGLELPPGYGYRMRKNDRWRINWMLMNHRLKVDTAYVEYTVTVDTAPDLTPVRPYWLGVVACKGDPIFNVPGGGKPNSTYSKRRDWVLPEGGRIVAANGHLHGGNKTLAVTQPRCGNRELLQSKPLYGQPDHPYYNVLPVLHEPGPMSSTWWLSGAGIPVAKGERLRVRADYDGEWVHPRVMGIMHVYVAEDRGAPDGCADLPGDVEERQSDYPGRTEPPRVDVPLTGLDSNGRARTIDRPPGKVKRFGGDARVAIGAVTFDLRNLSVPRGATVRWRSRAPEGSVHNVTLANGPEGPVGFGSQNIRAGGRFRRSFDVPGTYRLYCSLHPITMTQALDVRPGAAGGSARLSGSLGRGDLPSGAPTLRAGGLAGPGPSDGYHGP